MSTGARYEIVIDGTTRTYRDTIEGAWAAATNFKTKQPNAEITVRDLQTGTVTVIDHPRSR
jgi:FMN-dependent NADH-azoreductase